MADGEIQIRGHAHGKKENSGNEQEERLTLLAPQITRRGNCEKQEEQKPQRGFDQDCGRKLKPLTRGIELTENVCGAAHGIVDGDVRHAVHIGFRQ